MTDANAEGERIQKVLAHAGVASRRAVEDMIERGRIKVNGSKARIGQRIDVFKDKVEVDGAAVPLRTDLVHYLLNKPVGVVSTAADPEGRQTVVEIVDAPARVWPVGRLDLDSEGAIVLTNDGDLTDLLTHPRYGVTKTYLVEAKGSVADGVARRLARGVELEDGPSGKARVSVLERSQAGSIVEITIAEGRNRQVRRMFEAVGHPVRRLVRTAIGPLSLGRLKPGTYRRLSPQEVMELYRAARSSG